MIAVSDYDTFSAHQGDIGMGEKNAKAAIWEWQTYHLIYGNFGGWFVIVLPTL